jgi:hypothetical protein
MNSLIQFWNIMIKGANTPNILGWVWEFPQYLLGILVSLFVLRNMSLVSSFEKVTVISTEGHWGAISLGSFIIGDCLLKAEVGNKIFMHEFGHCLQSRRLGWLYLIVIGLPSFCSATFRKNHQTFWTERDANRRAVNYFRKHYGYEIWDYQKYPIS